MARLNINEFFALKTEYKNIAIGSSILFAFVILLFIIEIFIFWGIFGEGASASKISQLWYVKLIFNYLPIAIIGGYLVYKIITNYRNEKYTKSKTNIIILVILMVLFLIRNKIM